MKQWVNGWLLLVGIMMFVLPTTTLAQTETSSWQGVVERLPDGKIGEWVIGQGSFETTTDTVFDETNGFIELGACVALTYNQVEGVSQVVTITILLANQCNSQSSPTIEPTPTSITLESIRLQGFVEIRPNENSGTWVVNGLAVEANNETLLILNNGSAEIGSCVTIDYVPVGTTNIAIRLQTELIEICGELSTTPIVPAIETTWQGIVTLQGRTDYSGVEIFLSESLCATAMFAEPTTMTDSSGKFQVTTTDITYQCIQVAHPGYLGQQQPITTPDIAPLQLLAGDVNNDGVINILDIAILAGNYETDNPQADINGDGIVDILDIVHAAGNYQR